MHPLLRVGLTANATPGTPPNTTLPEIGSNMLSIFSHSGTNLFQTSFDPNEWHNFAIVVDWSNLTLQVFYSTNGCILQDVTDVVDNSSAGEGSIGDFAFGLVKVRTETLPITGTY
jgi:hypothetical protein